jgi:Protein of unknown function (DUF2778)
LTGRVRKTSSGKANSGKLFGGGAIACLLIGCGYIVHTNIIGASVYPTLGSASYEEPVVSHLKPAERSAAQAVSEAFSALAETTVVEKPARLAGISPTMFNERFAAAAAQGVPSRASEAPSAPGLDASKVADTAKPAEASKLAEAPKSKAAAPAQVALDVPTQSAPAAAIEAKPAKPAGLSLREMAQRAKAAVMSIANNEKPSITAKLWGKEPAMSHSSLLSYASAEASVTGSIGRDQKEMRGGAAPYDRDTAVYDISAHTVYLPDGSKLEAHSGLGSKLDDPQSAPIKMHGVTPPHLYELTPRETLFHGVPALRLNPIGGEEAIYGRAGLLAHTYMLGPNGDSNGCVSFKDYNAFLNAYRNQGIKKLAVVAKIE